MTEAQNLSAIEAKSDPLPAKRGLKKARRLVKALSWMAALLLACTAVAWLGTRASTVYEELGAVSALLQRLKEDVASNDPQRAASTVEEIRSHTSAAKQAAADPAWALASAIPVIGDNFSAVAEVARSADDVANLALAPLATVLGSLDWETTLAPSPSGIDLVPLQAASPSVSSAAHAVRTSASRLEDIDASKLIPQVADPLVQARSQLREVTSTLDASADASQLLPAMMGAGGSRSYLLMIQNNAEARASGGIPGALAVVTFHEGSITLSDQSSAGDLGVMDPAVSVSEEQQQIYSSRLGKFMQDVNLTPDFPTAAATAQTMWERQTGQQVDGVISMDPVALSYILNATGPVKITVPELVALASAGLPTELNGKNAVQTLLSDVYAKIEEPALQDRYFAGVAQEIFAALSDGRGSAKGLLEGLTRGTAEGRVLLWSGSEAEQSVIGKYTLSGSVAGPSVAPAQFGVYFNDGTGAKMDYYVKRTVQLVKECPMDGYEETSVRITSTNTAPADAATSLPAYVTGDGNFGVPPGFVQTNIVTYGPIQANIETAKLDGQRTEFAPYIHSNRPVGVVAVRLAPGESKTLEFTFGKIVQHTEPTVFVTPTVQPVKDVTLATENASCD